MAGSNYFLKQGDACALPVQLTIDGETVTSGTLDTISSVEFMVGESIRRTYPEDVTFDGENSLFLVPVTQEETFRLDEGETIAFDVRVGFAGGDVVGTKTMQRIKVLDALSEVEI